MTENLPIMSSFYGCGTLIITSEKTKVWIERDEPLMREKIREFEKKKEKLEVEIKNLDLAIKDLREELKI